MATIDILGIQHAYELTGSAASPHTLVFIHGWLLSRGYWQPLIERLSPDYECLAYDLRGFGQSANGLEPAGKLAIPAANFPTEANSLSLIAEDVNAIAPKIMPQEPPVEINSRYTAAAYARDLGLLLDELNINSAWLVGHSLGATIALWAADQLPERIKGVICINAGGGIYLKEAFEQFRSAGRQLVKIRPRWLCYLPLIDLLFTRANVVRPIARSWGRQRVIDFVVANSEAALGTLLDSTTEEEVNRLPQLVSQLSQPVYFLAGEQDQIMESKYVRHLASFHPLFQECGNNVVEIPCCGHLAMLEQTDTVAEEIRSILNRHQM